MARVAGLPQVADDGVGPAVDVHSGEEDRGTDIDIGAREPAVVVVLGGHEEDPAPLHQGVERVEDHAHRHDAERHLRAAADAQREDERAVDVVALEHREERQRRRLPRAVREEPQHRHGHADRGLHQHPAPLVGHGKAVARIEQIAVARLEKAERREHRSGRYGHDDQKNIECFLHKPEVGRSKRKDRQFRRNNLVFRRNIAYGAAFWKSGPESLYLP